MHWGESNCSFGPHGPYYFNSPQDKKEEESLYALGVNQKPCLFFFPPGCSIGIEYSSILVVGQPQPSIAWITRRLDGSNAGEWSLALVSPILKETYSAKAGYEIPEEEEVAIVNASNDQRWWFQRILSNQNSAVYGELTTEGVHSLIEILDLSAEDVFWDLGCGVGKAVVQVALETNVRASMGVELSTSRIKHGLASLEALQNSSRKWQKDEQDRIDTIAGNRLSLVCGDISKTSFKNGTHVYAGSLLFPDSLMVDIAVSLMDPQSKAKTFSTLRKFPEEVEEKYKRRLKLWKTVDISVSWTELTEMYVYKIRLPAGRTTYS